ncbi:hypothetical protein K7X08_030048 [Anisodus acutangulus]|uniref:Uncharacterized protein n=1 Tax=Anisodus acutangulus TaxID=402998 RepID=A0A9Q1R3Y2_9SOLA|nr:hypothetical protein K7X08_030048 [Anisodus acutangulus]
MPFHLQDLVQFNSRLLILLRTWSNCTFAQIASSAELFRFRKSLIGGSSSFTTTPILDPLKPTSEGGLKPADVSMHR